LDNRPAAFAGFISKTALDLTLPTDKLVAAL
jgi:hypothetical protein